MTDIADEPVPPNRTYPQPFVRFLRFGLLAFSGPVARRAAQVGSCSARSQMRASDFRTKATSSSHFSDVRCERSSSGYEIRPMASNSVCAR